MKRLLTYESCDKVQRAFLSRKVNISIADIKTIRNIIYDLEENEDDFTEEDLKIINNVGEDPEMDKEFNQDLYNLYYNSRKKYPDDFFLNKDYYDGRTISTGMFTIACALFKLKKEYLKKRILWGISNIC